MSEGLGRVDLVGISSFGGIDADVDALLRSCFQNHEAYLSTLNFERFLVLGRKGSGKTAIYKRLITPTAYNVFAFGHSFDDYPWSHHDLQAQVGVPEERRYIHSWKYLILIGLAKVLLNYDKSQPWSDESSDALEALEAFVVDSYGSRDPDLHQLFSPERELKLKGKFDLKLFSIESERVKVADLPRHIQEVNIAMERHIMAALNPSCKYYVCFDQLDLGFSVTDETYAQRLIGLLIAAKDLFVAGKIAGRSVNPVVFLRDDIFQDLQFEDKNKMTENYATRTVWSEDGPGLTLKSLMERRFSEVLGNEGSSKVSWDEVFDENKLMPGRQSKYRHICDRTFLRPRDMIKFCNEIAKSYSPSPESRSLFDNEALHAAREGYSDYLLSEIDDEIAKHVPRYREYLEVLKTLGSEKFDTSQFSEIFGQRSDLSGIRPIDALGDLFTFSVISYLKPGGRGGGSEYVWRYKDPRARFDSTLDSFRVHPGFKEALGLTR